MTKTNSLKSMFDEVSQGHKLRRPVYQNIEKLLGGKVRLISLFTSFHHPVVLEDSDADMLEEVLMNTEMDGKRLVLLLNCPGGDGLAAERIVNICRSFSGDGFGVIVPKMAKSAATMVCLGADEIVMSQTSELGPIDPQILIRDDRGQPLKYQAAHEIIASYEELINLANTTKGRSDPYLQQLGRYDARDIQAIRSAQKLSENIAVNMLKAGIFNKLTVANIQSKIRPLTDPNKTISHGRPLFHDSVKKCGLNVKLENNKSDLWRNIWDLYVRLNYVTTATRYSKVMESIDESFAVQVK